MKIPFKNPRATCSLCGKECAVKNIEPRHHRCAKLPKPKPWALTPTAVVACDVSVNIQVNELQRYLSGPQIEAVMNGLGLVIAAQKALGE